MQPPSILIVAGPTASGKSALALTLARQTQGTIINADAMQIYAGLPLLTAQPSFRDQKEIPHLLYDTLDPAEKSSAGRWLMLAREAIHQTLAAERTPIITGGTGLYLKALLGGLAEIPDVPAFVREKTQTLYSTSGEDAFRKALAKLDPWGAQHITKNDRQRLIRAYEVAVHTGKTLKEWQIQKGNDLSHDIPSPQNSNIHILLPSREQLYIACDQRFKEMLNHGVIDEVKEFLKRELDPDLPAMKTLGLREIAAYLKNTMTLDEAVAKAQQATRNYAKRQMTWFRNQKLIP